MDEIRLILGNDDQFSSKDIGNISSIILKKIKEADFEHNFFAFFFDANSHFYPQLLFKTIKGLMEKKNVYESFFVKYNEKFTSTFWNDNNNLNFSSFLNFISLFPHTEIQIVQLSTKMSLAEKNSITLQPNVIDYFASILSNHFDLFKGSSEYISIIQSFCIFQLTQWEIMKPYSFQLLRLTSQCIIKNDLNLEQKISTHSPFLSISNNLLSILLQTVIIHEKFFENKLLIQENQNIILDLILSSSDLNPESRIPLYQSYFEYYYENLEPISNFILIDFDTSIFQIRNCLQSLFEPLLRSEKVAVVLQPFFKLLCFQHNNNSRLKRFLLPYLISNFWNHTKKNSLIYDLICISQEYTSKNLIIKCLSPFQKNPLPFLQKILTIYSENYSIKETQPSLILILETLLKSKNKNIKNSDIFAMIQSSPHHIAVSFSLDLLCVISKQDPNELRNWVKFGFSSINIDLRIKALATFFKNDMTDTELFQTGFQSILTIDSPSHQSVITSLVEDYSNRNFKSSQVQPLIPSVSQILQTILDISFQHILPLYTSNHRQFAFSIMKRVIERFPSLKFNHSFLQSITSDPSSPSSLVHNIINLLSNKSEPQIEINDNDFETIDGIKRCKILLEGKNVKLNINQDIIPKLIMMSNSASQWEDQWTILVTITLLQGKIQIDDSLIETVSETFFNLLLNARKAGLIYAAHSGLEKLLVVSFSKKTPLIPKFSNTIISSLEEYDMAGMRRSASLPFVSSALIRASLLTSERSDFSLLFTKRIVELVQTTKNANAAANGLNILKVILPDCSQDNSESLWMVFPLLFQTLRKFLDSWDVLSAVSLCFQTIIRCIWRNFGSPNFEPILSRPHLFSQNKIIREHLIDAIENGCPLETYLALFLITKLGKSIGDPVLFNIVSKKLGSRNSRIRREASRACAALAGLNNKLVLDKVKDLLSETKSQNILHGIFLLLLEANIDCPFEIQDVQSLAPMAREAYLMLLCRKHQIELCYSNSDFKADEAGSFVAGNQFPKDSYISIGFVDQMLRKIRSSNECNVPIGLVEYLTQKLIVEEFDENLNETFILDGLLFLGKFGVPYLKFTKPQIYIIGKHLTQTQSPEIGAALLGLLNNQDETEIQDAILEVLKANEKKLFDYAFDYSGKLVHAQESLSHLVQHLVKFERGIGIVMVLLLNDIPKIRTEAACRLYGLNELISIETLKNKIKDSSIITDISSRWIEILDDRSNKEVNEDPLTVFISEDGFIKIFLDNFEIPKHTIPTSIKEYREVIISTAKNCLTSKLFNKY